MRPRAAQRSSLPPCSINIIAKRESVELHQQVAPVCVPLRPADRVVDGPQVVRENRLPDQIAKGVALGQPGALALLDLDDLVLRSRQPPAVDFVPVFPQSGRRQLFDLLRPHFGDFAPQLAVAVDGRPL